MRVTRGVAGKVHEWEWLVWVTRGVAGEGHTQGEWLVRVTRRVARDMMDGQRRLAMKDERERGEDWKAG